jgi:hypothetical protein
MSDSIGNGQPQHIPSTEIPMSKLLSYAKRVLVIFEKSLQEIGRRIGQLTNLALAIALFVCPIFALVLASFCAAFGVVNLLGGGEFLIFLLFWFFVGLIGWYVSPHVQPKVSEALLALLKDDPPRKNRSDTRDRANSKFSGRSEVFDVVADRQ